MKTKTVHICGTGSGVGKSVIVAALCRIFREDGYKVCPFKAQNMALNSFVTKSGGEIGRAQAVQAQAAGVEPSVDMNPVLLKPCSDTGAQVIVRGRPIGNMHALEYIRRKKELLNTVLESFHKLKKKYEMIVMEGAGSPAEINLRRHDIVNIKMAELAGAPVILVGDIDKGGVFAWIVGTLELLTAKERKMVKGIIINKFRGDKSLLESGLRFLERRTGIKVLGVVPYFKDIRIPEEDAIPEQKRIGRRQSKSRRKDLINIAVIGLPHISNFTDFDPLEREKDVVLGYTRDPEELDRADVIILPGTKNTIADINWLKTTGLAAGIKDRLESDNPPVLVGICGGFQMLGRKISDPLRVESGLAKSEGLRFLDITTTFQKKKTTTRVKAKETASGMQVEGYEIHHGKTERAEGVNAMFKIVERNGRKIAEADDGATNSAGTVWGTYLHAVFENNAFRKSFLNNIRKKKRSAFSAGGEEFDQDAEFAKLARLVRNNIDTDYLYAMLK